MMIKYALILIMFVATLNRTDGKSITIEIPEISSEIKLRCKIDFTVAEMELDEWIRINHEDLLDKKHEYILLLIKCISAYSGVKFDEFTEIDSKYLSEISNTDLIGHFDLLSKDVFPKDEKNKDKLSVKKLHKELLKIYFLITNCIKEAKPALRNYGSEFFDYTYIDPDTKIQVTERFQINPVWQNKYMNRLEFKPLSVKQLVEILEIEEAYKKTIASNLRPKPKPQDKKLSKSDRAKMVADGTYHQAPVEELQNPDPLGQFIYSKIISEIAVICTKENEVLPHDKHKFKQWLDHRCRIFTDIDLQTAIDVEYWINSFWDYLQKEKENYHFFNARTPIDEHEQKARIKLQAINQEIFDRIGYRSLISRLMEIDPWSSNGKSKLESVSNAPADEGVTLISIENSKL